MKNKPDYLSERLFNNLKRFAADVPFVTDNATPVFIEIHAPTQMPFIKMSSVKRYRDKKDFLSKVSINPVELEKYNSFNQLNRAFNAYKNFQDGICGVCLK